MDKHTFWSLGSTAPKTASAVLLCKWEIVHNVVLLETDKPAVYVNLEFLSLPVPPPSLPDPTPLVVDLQYYNKI